MHIKREFVNRSTNGHAENYMKTGLQNLIGVSHFQITVSSECLLNSFFRHKEGIAKMTHYVQVKKFSSLFDNKDMIDKLRNDLLDNMTLLFLILNDDSIFYISKLR